MSPATAATWPDSTGVRHAVDWGAPTRRTHRRAKPILHLENVAKSFRMPDGELTALAGVDLRVAPGELVAIVGPHGAGLSLLLSLIAGLESPSAGRIWCAGRRVRSAGPDRPLLFSNTGLFPWMHARGNVQCALRQGTLPAFEQAALARRCLDLVSMHAHADTPVRELTEAERHRVALARALATGPAMLLMDEPFARLHTRERERLHEELQAVWTATRLPILFATHDVAEAVTLADRVIVLSPRPGRIVAEVPIDVPRPRSAGDGGVHTCAREVAVGLRAAAA